MLIVLPITSTRIRSFFLILVLGHEILWKVLSVNDVIL